MPKYNPPFVARSGETLESEFLYNERQYYKIKTKEIFEDINPNYIDLWYETPLYGKVNPKGEFVFPKRNLAQTSIHPDSSGNPTIKGFDFSMKALNEYMFFLRRGFSAGRTGLNFLLNNFQVVSGYVDPLIEYRKHVSRTMNTFNDYAIRTGKYSKIDDFEKFICSVMDTLESVDENLTFFYYFTSNKTNLSSTGLSFRFLDANQDDDYLKNKFFQHSEFSKYVNTAANFGFRINKNAPWEIVVDVNSKPMMTNRKIKRRTRRDVLQRNTMVPGYLQEKIITSPTDFFKKYYLDLMDRSYYYFKKLFISAYNQYAERIVYTVDYGRPYISFENFSNIISDREYGRTEPSRKFLNIYEFGKYNDLFFLEKYERMLNMEFKNKFNRRQYTIFKNNFDRATNKSKSHGEAYLLLREFYSNLTKIYHPHTKELMWNSPKKPLTDEKDRGIIQTKSKPTASRVVTEFLPDL